jgi:hypothetical protein
MSCRAALFRILNDLSAQCGRQFDITGGRHEGRIEGLARRGPRHHGPRQLVRRCRIVDVMLQGDALGLRLIVCFAADRSHV